jgi:hypothetical protein
MFWCNLSAKELAEAHALGLKVAKKAMPLPGHDAPADAARPHLSARSLSSLYSATPFA